MEKLKMIRKEAVMDKTKEKEKGIPFNLENEVAYADGSVVSKTLLNSAAGILREAAGLI